MEIKFSKISFKYFENIGSMNARKRAAYFQQYPDQHDLLNFQWVLVSPQIVNITKKQTDGSY